MEWETVLVSLFSSGVVGIIVGAILGFVFDRRVQIRQQEFENLMFEKNAELEREKIELQRKSDIKRNEYSEVKLIVEQAKKDFGEIKSLIIKAIYQLYDKNEDVDTETLILLYKNNVKINDSFYRNIIFLFPIELMQDFMSLNRTMSKIIRALDEKSLTEDQMNELNSEYKNLEPLIFLKCNKYLETLK